MKDSYLTIKETTEGLYKEKGSKFLAFAFPVRNEEEIKAAQDGLRKKYHDARHHCYAYILGRDMTDIRANDDGEPNHSAGDPILNQIRSRELSDVLVVVVRYFGGTKLGVSGLINAYKTATTEALDAAKLVKRIVYSTVKVEFDYQYINELMVAIKDLKVKFVEQNIDNRCDYVLKIRESELPQFIDMLDKNPNLDYTLLEVPQQSN